MGLWGEQSAPGEQASSRHPALGHEEPHGATRHPTSVSCCHMSPFSAHPTLILILQPCCARPWELQRFAHQPRGEAPQAMCRRMRAMGGLGALKSSGEHCSLQGLSPP